MQSKINSPLTAPMSPDEHYKLIVEEHRFASEFRLKILTVWGAVYAGLAAVFIWAFSATKSIDWIAPLVGIGMTILLWIGDRRNRPAIGRSKDIGVALETKLNLPDDQQFFAKLDRGSSHSTAIDIFAMAMMPQAIFCVRAVTCRREKAI